MRWIALILGLAWALPLGAVPDPAALGSPTAKAAAEAAEDLRASVAGLEAARGAKDRIKALTATIRAYEAGLAALREALRQADLRQTELTMQFQAKRGDLSALLGVLAGMEGEGGPLLLLHPNGPLGTVRSGMILSDVAPGLQREAETLKADLTELRDLRALQIESEEVLTNGLAAVQSARMALSTAMSERTDLPKRLTEDPEALARLQEGAATLAEFAAGLAPDGDLAPGFATAEGTLSWPARGSVVLRAGETDARGVTRPGLSLAVRPLALVTAPWSATIRYRGPLLDYGNVMILEPGDGYLLILGGLAEVYGDVGDVVSKGDALGLMGGAEGKASDLLAPNGSGASESETLYVELRKDGEPIDPMAWFVPEGEWE